MQAPPSSPASLGGAGAGSSNDAAYSMSPEEKARYLNHFAPCDVNGDGYVEGLQAVELFSRSGLDRGK